MSRSVLATSYSDKFEPGDRTCEGLCYYELSKDYK